MCHKLLSFPIKGNYGAWQYKTGFLGGFLDKACNRIRQESQMHSLVVPVRIAPILSACSDSQDFSSSAILLYALITKQNRSGISLPKRPSLLPSHISTCSYSLDRRFSSSRLLSIRSGFAGCPWEQCNPCPALMDWIKPLIVKWKSHQTLYGKQGPQSSASRA